MLCTLAFLRAAGLLAVGFSFASATTLIAIWSPQRLLIGADSRVITNIPNVLGNACKIEQTGSTYYAFNGLVADKTAGYNIESLAREAVQGTGDLSAHMHHFLDLAREPLARAVAAVKHDSPDQYQYLQHNHPLLQAIFADTKPKPPTLGVAGFSLSPDGKLVDVTKIIAQSDDGLGLRIVYAGQQDQLKKYLHDHRDWPNGDQADLIRHLIQSEIDGGHGEVGGPIDILSIGQKGAEWVQRKPGCK